MRRATVRALASCGDAAITTALLGPLTDDSPDVRWEAVAALARRESPQDLIALANEIRRLSRPTLLHVADAAEQLMARHYRRIEPQLSALPGDGSRLLRSQTTRHDDSIGIDMPRAPSASSSAENVYRHGPELADLCP